MELALITIFSTSFLLALSGAMMPGPLLTVTVSESTRRGVIAGPLMILGHGLLELVLVVALLAGLAPFLVRDDVFIAIALFGGSILLWMGFSMFRELPNLSLQVQSSEEKQKNLIISGVVLSAINPYWLIWWASIGIGYIMHSLKTGLIGVVAFFVGHIFADLAWYAFISFGIAKGRHLFSDLIYRRLIGACAVFLILFGCWFIYNGMQRVTTAF